MTLLRPIDLPFPNQSTIDLVGTQGVMCAFITLAEDVH
jgi:hypothetical protein